MILLRLSENLFNVNLFSQHQVVFNLDYYQNSNQFIIFLQQVFCLPNAWVTLKPTVGRPDFLCWSADKHGLDRPTGAVTLKTYLTNYLHRPQSFPFGRPSTDCISLSGNMQRVRWRSADLGVVSRRLPDAEYKIKIYRPTIWQWSVDHRPTAFPCRATYNESADLLIVDRRWTNH